MRKLIVELVRSLAIAFLAMACWRQQATPPVVPPVVVSAAASDSCEPGSSSGAACICPEGYRTTQDDHQVARCEPLLDGVVGGSYDPDASWMSAPPPPPPPPPPPAPPMTVPPRLIEGSRTAGEKLITPDTATQRAILAAGQQRVVGSFKLCVGLDGGVDQVVLLKSTGYAAYDARIHDGMKSWRYRPYLVNGAATRVCTAVTFIFTHPAL